jgi:lytic murein transglycosylase
MQIVRERGAIMRRVMPHPAGGVKRRGRTFAARCCPPPVLRLCYRCRMIILLPATWALVFLVALALPSPILAAVDRPAIERQFQAWLQKDLWSQAKAADVSRQTFDAAFSGVTLDFSLPELETSAPPAAEQQAEFRSPAAYFNESRLAGLARAGRARLSQWDKTLTAIEKRYGIPRGIIVAIWARESGFGATALPEPAVRALATGAFIGRRKDLFRGELIAVLKILEAGDTTPARMRSSWAGALGQPQFLPSQFPRYAVDFDGNGKRDIWDSVPDSLASIANFLKQAGWKADRGWGLEAFVPAGVACHLEGPEQGKPLGEWAKLGVRGIDGTPLPQTSADRLGFILMPAGRFGPAFIVTENFYVLKAYNNSDLYALYVSHLADRFGEGQPFRTPWSKTTGFTRANVAAMQRKLQAKGDDVGATDGLIGFKTRIAVGKWQAAHGRPVTCYPDAAMLRDVR